MDAWSAKINGATDPLLQVLQGKTKAIPPHTKIALQTAQTSETAITDGDWLVIRRRWGKEEVEVSFTVKPRFVFSNPLVRVTAASKRYCEDQRCIALKSAITLDDLPLCMLLPATR